ncbi:MAG: nucleotidyltransferase domain-containing protein [Prevotellaceae bacterium]|jgi:predicted nucleotidyltransferase|nr:nucleotidyltransferase domain-containing protein [Prevotellaceae bacterium]
MIIRTEIAKRQKEFLSLCNQHHVRSLYAFGSATTDHFDAVRSDIDLLVDLYDDDPIRQGEELLSLWDNFESFFRRKVDLLTLGSVRNPFLRRSIDSQKVLIYDGAKQQVFV